MFVKNEAKISSRVGGVKWRVVYFGKLVFEADEELRVRRLADIQEDVVADVDGVLDCFADMVFTESAQKSHSVQFS